MGSCLPSGFGSGLCIIESELTAYIYYLPSIYLFIHVTSEESFYEFVGVLLAGVYASARHSLLYSANVASLPWLFPRPGTWY